MSNLEKKGQRRQRDRTLRNNIMTCRMKEIVNLHQENFLGEACENTLVPTWGRELGQRRPNSWQAVRGGWVGAWTVPHLLGAETKTLCNTGKSDKRNGQGILEGGGKRSKKRRGGHYMPKNKGKEKKEVQHRKC